MSCSYPIILTHGICPFDWVFSRIRLSHRPNDDRYHYFRKIRSTLRANGYDAFHSRVSWAADIKRRAWDLRGELNRITRNFEHHPRVHIIAHSMGGLDARYMINHYHMEDHVASLTTIGTPHLGTSFADWGLKRFGGMIAIVRTMLSLDLSGFKNLTREYCRDFNRLWEDFERRNTVAYQTIAGVQPLDRTFAPLRPSYRIIWRKEGENDGLVSLKSAMWEERYFLRKIDADHLNQIGWWDRGEAKGKINREAFEKGIREIYLGVARGLNKFEP